MIAATPRPRSPAELEARRRNLPRPTFPEELPIAAKRAEIGDYFGSVAIFRDVSRRFFNREAADVAAQVIDELVKAGVLMEQDGDIVARGN